MALEPWLPIGFKLPDGAKLRVVLFGGTDWQIYETMGGGRALIVQESVARRWQDSGLIDKGNLDSFDFGEREFRAISCSPSQILAPVDAGNSPNDKSEALSFALALKATRDIDPESALQDALYIEKISRLLPTYSISSRTNDDVVLGYWLTGGMSIPATSFRRLLQAISWLGASHLMDVVKAAGFDVTEIIPVERKAQTFTQSPREITTGGGSHIEQLANSQHPEFELAGRPELAAFFNEHIIDIILNPDRYKALGITFPSATILHGPPGCGKTFAVERLVDFLGWPCYQIDASSVASPYIHETSKKVAQIFDRAMENAPSVLIIDEMEAFLADREMGSGHHRVEEVAEFLRRIPEAVNNDVLIIAMTNRIELIDHAIQRRGRFDHVIRVDFASEAEVKGLLDSLISSLPISSDVDTEPLAVELAGRPLSDVSFVVREGARLAARQGKDHLNQASLLAALKATPARERECDSPRPEGRPRIGFV